MKPITDTSFWNENCFNKAQDCAREVHSILSKSRSIYILELFLGCVLRCTLWLEVILADNYESV